MIPKPMPIRLFNADGISAFRAYLGAVKAGQGLDAPLELLEDTAFTERIAPNIPVQQHEFVTTREIINYLHSRIFDLKLADTLYNVGLWTWLSAYFFDMICPITNGERRVGDESRYILNSSYWRYNRHLLAAPFRFTIYHRDKNELITYTPPSKLSEYLRLITEAQELMTSPGVIEALHILYWDSQKATPKRGAVTRGQVPGSVQRFITLLNQFSLTFDLQGMTGRQIIQLLPKREFDRWK